MPTSALRTVLLFILAMASSGIYASEPDTKLRQAQTLIDDNRPEEALELLRSTKGKGSAEALLLRSTAQIMIGDTAAGFRDLERALELDPKLRQGWLNLAGMEIAEGRLDAAYAALEKARVLDPDAEDNHLNLGAVRVMQGQLDAAREHFSRYVSSRPGVAEAHYLVASNYAISGYEPPAVEHLRQAIALDERLRLRARSDERFLGLRSEEYRELLSTDSYRPTPGSHAVAAAFETTYSRTDPRLVYAVLDAFQGHGLTYDPAIEATEAWALVWGEMRAKVYNQTNGTGVVSFSAPAGAFQPDDWHRRTQALFSSIRESLERGERRRLRLPPPPP